MKLKPCSKSGFSPILKTEKIDGFTPSYHREVVEETHVDCSGCEFCQRGCSGYALRTVEAWNRWIEWYRKFGQTNDGPRGIFNRDIG